MEITLEQLLAARDRRAARQLALTQAWPDRTLVCLTVVLPGPVKRDARSLTVAAAAVAAVRDAFTPAYEELHDLPTGYEAYFLIDAPLLEVKKRCCEIENTHPYGRLMDLDVLKPVWEASQPSLTSSPQPADLPADQLASQTSGGEVRAALSSVAVAPVSRERVGEPPRRCLLCGRPARECMRARSHTPAEISAAIDRLLGL